LQFFLLIARFIFRNFAVFPAYELCQGVAADVANGNAPFFRVLGGDFD